MPSVITDFRHAARALQRNAGFSVAAVAALSLGIGATTAIFSVVNKVLLEPLPYPDPDRIVQLMSESPVGDQRVVSIPKFGLWRDQSMLFQAIAAYDFAGPGVNLTEDDSPEPLETARVSADYFRLFGAGVAVGRTFSEKEDRPDSPCVAVLSDRLWRHRFHASSALVGNTVSLDHEPCKVVGVLAPGFEAEKPVDIWLPLQADFIKDGHMNRVQVAARLKTGVSVKIAAASLQNTKSWFVRKYPEAPLLFREGFTAVPLRDALVGDVRPALLLLIAAVTCVLLIACANVGSLVLARNSRRAAEIALRAALGAGRGLLLRQLLNESLLLAFASAVVGLVLGFGGVRALLALSPPDLPRIGANGSAIALDWPVFLFTLVVAMASVLLFGLMPAIGASRANLVSLINDSPLQSGMGFRRGGRRAALVISEVALALILLVGAGLLIRTFAASRTTNRGFDEQHVLTAQMSLNGPQFERTAQVTGLIRGVERRMKRIPGVSQVATTSALPLDPGVPMPLTITRHDQSMVGRYHGSAVWRSVSPNYFDVFRIHLLLGRLFSDKDDEDAAGVVVINRIMMKRFWPEVDADPIGEFIIIGKGVSAELEDFPRQIIGIVDDVREAGLNREPMMYVPVAQLPDGMTRRNNRLLPLTWVLRTSGDDGSQGAIEHDLKEASGLPPGRVRSMHQIVAASSARAEFYSLLFIVFGVVALLLAAAGLYGVMAYSVQQRTREIGLRMALGAAPDHIRKMVVWQGMRLALAGIGVGIPVAIAASRVIVSLIFGVKPWDPAVFAGVAILLAAAALTAAYVPSIRATAVDPCESLRR